MCVQQGERSDLITPAAHSCAKCILVNLGKTLVDMLVEVIITIHLVTPFCLSSEWM